MTRFVGQSPIGVGMLVGIGAGVAIAFVGWEPALRLWPLLLVPLLFTRFYVPAGIAAVVGLLTALSIGQLNSSVAQLPKLGEVQFGEALIYAQSFRLLHHEPLYQPLDRAPFTIALYTPLYYYVV